METIGTYELKRLLGRGGMGSVYLAHDSRLDRDIALKVLSPELAEKKEFLERFQAEAQSSAVLSHPNITTICDVGETDGVQFIAFEYVEGETLDELLVRRGGLPLEEVLGIAIPVANAIFHAHQQGIVHRDLKPANILIANDGAPKVLDFGLAKMIPSIVDTEARTVYRLTQVGMVVGTIEYMSPEQALGKSVDARGDVFAFGCLLYEMATGRAAFTGGTATQIVDRVLHEEPTPLISVRPDLPSELNRVIEKALRKDRDERYQHMDDLEADLRHLIRHSDSQQQTLSVSSSPVLYVDSFVTKVKMHWQWIAVGGLLVILTMLGIVDKLVPHSSAPANSVAVMYFQNLDGSTDDNQTSEMLEHLLTQELSLSGKLNVLSRQRLGDIAIGLGAEEGELNSLMATRVAQQGDLGAMVIGRLAHAGNHLLVTTELIEVDTGRTVASQRAEAVTIDEIFLVAEELGRQLRADLANYAGYDDDISEWDKGRRTHSVAAYRHYVQGQKYTRRGQLESAVWNLREAVSLDPEFALAHFRLSMAARWLSDGPLSHQAARRAALLVDRSPARYREIIRANAFYQDGAYAQALPLLEKALLRNPDQREALYIASQIYFHSLRDGDIDRAIELMERVLATDPGFYQVYDRLALGYALRGNMELARERLSTWETERRDKVMGLRSVLATIEGQPEEALGFSESFSWIEAPLFQVSAAILAGRWDLVNRLVNTDVDEWRSDHLRAWALRNRAVFHTYMGEFDKASGFYQQAGSASGLRTHEGVVGGVSASALQIVAELYFAVGELGKARAETERALSIQPESWRGLYFAARFALADGDIEAAEIYRQTLSELGLVRTSRGAKMYRRAIQGEIALWKGEAVKAARIFENILSEHSLMEDWASTCSSAGAAIRNGLVRAYLAIGDEVAARNALENLLMSGMERLDHPVHYVQSLYRLGILEFDAGNAEKGRSLLERFLEHWGHTKWRIPSIEDAKNRLSS